MLDLSCSSWLMAAARMANLFLGKPTCSMNESPSPVSCFGFDLLEGGHHWHKPRLCVFKNGCLLSKVFDLFEFLKTHSRAINESLMRNRWFESFIPHLLLSFIFLNGCWLRPFMQKLLNSALCCLECTIMFSTPAVFRLSVALSISH